MTLRKEGQQRNALRIDRPLDSRRRPLLMVRHFAEHAPSILVLTFFYFNVLVMECRLLCPLARVFNRNEHGNAPFS